MDTLLLFGNSVLIDNKANIAFLVLCSKYLKWTCALLNVLPTAKPLMAMKFNFLRLVIHVIPP